MQKRLFSAGLLTLGLAGSAAAQGTPPTVEDLQNLSIEDLANIEVTSVSKRPQSLSEAAAAVYVITSEDIRRSGMTSLPEILRLAPNLEVARVSAYSWTVTARGFNSPATANKLLVLVDGRSVYEPIASTILWQQVDVAADNIERIEVISGPGGTMWGANAVNGVVNIITKHAADTQGASVHATVGVYKRGLTVNYGGKAGDSAHYRLSLDGFSGSSTRPVDPANPFQDDFRGVSATFRLDGKRDDDTYGVKAQAYNNSIVEDGGTFKGYNVMAGWARPLEDGSTVSVDAYFDHNKRDEPTLMESRDMVNLDAQHTLAPKGRHQIVWGGEARMWQENFVSYNAFHFDKPKTTISLASVFVQDEISLKPDLRLILGLKAEHNSYSGLDWLPNVRLAWQRDKDNLLWAAASRAVRTPNRIERELVADGILLPSPRFGSESLTAFEAGWRGQGESRWSASVSVFYNLYDDLRTDTYTPVTIVPLILENGGRGTTYGVEAWGRFQVTPAWRLSYGFNWLEKDFELKPGYIDFINLGVQGQDPPYQAQIRSEWNITDAVELDVALRHIAEVDTAPVPAYTEANIHLAWQVRDHLELALNGINLLNPRHIEVWDPAGLQPRYVGRSVFVSLRAGF